MIIKPDLSDEAKKDLVNKYIRWLKDASDKRAVKVEDWGVKGLAFPIREFKSGHYALFTHYASDEGIKEFHKLLDTEDHVVLKYTSIRQTEEALFEAGWDVQDESEQYPKTVDALDVALGLAKY